MLSGLYYLKEEVGCGSCAPLEEEHPHPCSVFFFFLPEMEPESDPAQIHKQLTGSEGL